MNKLSLFRCQENSGSCYRVGISISAGGDPIEVRLLLFWSVISQWRLYWTGAIALTAIPSGASSTDITLVSCMRPALDAP